MRLAIDPIAWSRILSNTLPLATTQANLDLVGGKGMSLANLTAAAFPVPDGFHLTCRAYDEYISAYQLHDQIQALAQPQLVDNKVSFASAAHSIQVLLQENDIPSGIAEEIRSAYGLLDGDNPAVAIRSSANAEDLPDLSFAGQQDTYLNVQGLPNVIDAIRSCWASLWTERALNYRYEMDIDNGKVAMAVVVQQMVNAEVAGVLFTANVMTGDRTELLVNASYGLGEAVVSGQVTPDSFIVDRHDFHVRLTTTGSKEAMVVPETDGITTKPVLPEAQQVVSLSSNQLDELAKLAMDVEQHYAGVHQDIEWAFADGKLWLLQSRPITRLPPPPIEAKWEPPFPGAYLIRRGWVEHLLGPVSPLFESVYLELGLEDAYQKREGSLRRKQLPKPRHTTVNGWAYARYGPQAPVLQNRFEKWFQGYWMFIDLVISYRFSWLPLWRYWGLPLYLSRIQRWEKIVPADASVETLYLGLRSLADADAEYWVHASRVQGLSKMANARMTAFLSEHAPEASFVRGTVGDVKLQASTDLLSGYPSKSNDALGEVVRIAEDIRADSALTRLVLITPVSRLMAVLESDPIGYKTAAAITAYLHRYGHQTFSLDFVEPTQLEAPAAMLSNLKAMVAGTGATDPMAVQADTEQRRENTAVEALAYFEEPVRSQFAKRYRLDTRNSRHREDAMFYMGAAWAVLRPMALELGQRLVDAGSLLVAEDIFYVTNDELLTAVEPLTEKAAPGMLPSRLARWAMSRVFGAPPDTPKTAPVEEGEKPSEPDVAIPGLKEKAQAQRQLREAHKRLHPPAAIPRAYMESVKGMLTQQIINDDDSDVIVGFATSAGTITAAASVLFSPEDFERMVPGSILVCPFTTPAWTQLFIQASGLVTDIGGIGGHGSIVAREYGIPAVMGTGIGTRRIVHGQVITVDGDAGTVSFG